MAKTSSQRIAPTVGVRTRRAYFDCRFGQLHVRTAFPTTGGFDEGVTLFCLHPADGSSRTFSNFLPEIATDRSVYAPDLPGHGESDAAPAMDFIQAAGAVADLARDLRLRQIDVLGFRFGAGAALELAAARPELVRRLVLVGIPAFDRLPPVTQPSLVLRIQPAAEDVRGTGVLPRVKYLDLPESTSDLFEVAPKTLAKQIGTFLEGKS